MMNSFVNGNMMSWIIYPWLQNAVYSGYGEGYYSVWSPISTMISLVLFGLVIYFGYNAFHNAQHDKKWAWLFIASIILLILFGGSGFVGFGIIGLLMVFGMLVMVLFWGAIIWLVFHIFKSIVHDSENSQEILKKRYASGEISKKQFEAMKKDLR